MTKRNRNKMTVTVPAELYLWAGTEANLRETSLSAIVTESLALRVNGFVVLDGTGKLLKVVEGSI